MTGVSHRYYLPRLPNHEDEWSVVFIDQDFGILSITSDWGNFTHWWGRSGRVYHDFRMELLRFDAGYLQNKLADHQNMRFDAEVTIERVRADICYERRRLNITKEQARDDWEAIEGIDNEWDWCEFLYHSDDHRHEAYREFGEYHPSNINSLHQWIEKSWPRLQDELRADVAARPIPTPPDARDAILPGFDTSCARLAIEARSLGLFELAIAYEECRYVGHHLGAGRMLGSKPQRRIEVDRFTSIKVQKA